MDLDARARVHAMELLVTELIADHLRSAPDPAERARHAGEQLRGAADRMPLEAADLDEEARLRVRIKDAVSGILAAALAKARGAASA